VKGVPVIVEVVEEFIRNLAIVLHNIHIGMNPDAILIGGGIVEAKSVWWQKLEMVLASVGSTVTVLPALLGNQAGSIGAARYAMLGSGVQV
jgi:glucokinase